MILESPTVILISCWLSCLAQITWTQRQLEITATILLFPKYGNWSFTLYDKQTRSPENLLILNRRFYRRADQSRWCASTFPIKPLSLPRRPSITNDEIQSNDLRYKWIQRLEVHIRKLFRVIKDKSYLEPPTKPTMVAISAHLKLAFAWVTYINTLSIDQLRPLMADNFVSRVRPSSLGYGPVGKEEYLVRLAGVPMKNFNVSCTPSRVTCLYVEKCDYRSHYLDRKISLREPTLSNFM